MICPYCQFPNETNETFCANCGAPLPAKKKPAAQPPGPGAPPPGAPQQPGAPPSFTQQPTALQPPPQAAPGAYGSAAAPAAAAPQPAAAAQTGMPVQKKKKSGCVIAVIIIGILLVLSAIVAILVISGMGFWLVQAGDDEQLPSVEVAAVAEPDEAGKPVKAVPAEKEDSKPAEAGKALAEKPNPLLENPPKERLYQSQVFLLKDRIKYAGAVFSIRQDIRLYSGSGVPDGVSLKKGYVMADVEIAVTGKTSLKKFKLYMMDGKGKQRKPDTSMGRKMDFPEDPGEIHKLWNKKLKIPRDKTFYLHAAFSVKEKSAHDFIIEIQNKNVDRVLWIAMGTN